jgi:hypothetical protein
MKLWKDLDLELLKILGRNIWMASLVFLYEDIEVLEDMFIDSEIEKILKEKDMLFIYFLQRYTSCLFITTLNFDSLIIFLNGLFSKGSVYLYETIYELVNEIVIKNKNQKFAILLKELQNISIEIQTKVFHSIPIPNIDLHKRGNEKAKMINIHVNDDSDLEEEDF